MPQKQDESASKILIIAMLDKVYESWVEGMS